MNIGKFINCFSFFFLNIEYDGSPRRFGQSQNNDTTTSALSSLYSTTTGQSSKVSSLFTSPRPGFPQVVYLFLV